jgi:Rieske Fe-S protein
LAEESTRRNDTQKRRRFLETFFGASVAASLASFLYPVLRYMIPSSTTEPSSGTALAAHVGELKPNSGKIFRFGNRPALLILTPDGTYRAMSAVCTHLGCTVQYRSDLHLVWCACHNGMYSVDGRNISGPPPRPLETYQVVMQGNDIYARREGNG